MKIGLKWQKLFVCCIPCLRNYTSHALHLWCTYVNISMLFFFFSFFQNFDFLGHEGSKRANKWLKMIKSFCRDPYLRKHASWLWFLVYIFKMMISLGAIFSFSVFWFSRLLGGGVKGPKMAENDKELCILVSLHVMIVIFGRYV